MKKNEIFINAIEPEFVDMAYIETISPIKPWANKFTFRCDGYDSAGHAFLFHTKIEAITARHKLSDAMLNPDNKAIVIEHRIMRAKYGRWVDWQPWWILAAVMVFVIITLSWR